MSLSPRQLSELQGALAQAVVDCSQRCLYHSARWAAELMNSTPDHEYHITLGNAGHAPQRNRLEMALEQAEMPKYLMAKTFFDCHEFRRCAETVFPSGTSSPSIAFGKAEQAGISQRRLFLAGYALLILGEKQKTEDAGQILGPLDTGTVANCHLLKIRSVLDSWFGGQDAEDPPRASSEGWLEYLYGMTLAKDQLSSLAKTWLLKSVAINPWNWGAWQELCSLVRNSRELDSIHAQLQPSLMAFIFSIHCRQELHQTTAALVSDISQLLTIFPRSSFIQSQRALVSYRMNDVLAARSLFAEILLSNPMYLDFLDHYSNVLYKMESKDALAFTAQLASAVDPHRPETCCVVGNYYSLSSRHEEAVGYFRRALLLDRNCAAAWTLLGHEYAKLENFHAAISSYMRAIALNKKDYRAYFGLGQCYGFLERPIMSLDFYRRALALRPGELDIWRALADCLLALSKVPQAISALTTALHYTEGILRENGDEWCESPFIKRGRLDALFQLATVLWEDNDEGEATKHMQQCLDEAARYCEEEDEEDSSDVHTSLIPKAQLSLIRWALENDDQPRARYLASQMKELGEHREEVSRLLDTIASSGVDTG
ncbi:cell division cycle protein-like protein 23 [Nemania sp. NC0429]|nr:cell division cycle protein-like protein 23 [Nemania sp. NC0429]